MDLRGVVRPGDLVVIGQGIGEPVSLVRSLAENASRLAGTEVFIGIGYGDEIMSLGDLDILSFGAIGTVRKLSAAERLGVMPVPYVDVARHILHRASTRRIILMIQVAPADEFGRHSLGVTVDYTLDLVPHANEIVVEINDHMPSTRGPSISADAITASCTVSRPLMEVSTPEPTEVQHRIASRVCELIDDGSTIQLGIGSLPSAVASQLVGHKELRVHTGVVGDWLLTLHDAGALADAPIVVGCAAGSHRLYEFLANDARCEMRSIGDITRPDVVSSIPRFVAINSALQVDLTGQVNAEGVEGRYLGGIGGQPDFFRGAQLGKAGMAILAIPSMAGRSGASTIVPELDQGVVTTTRSNVDVVVTEFGVADLRGLTLPERRLGLTAISDPSVRERLAPREPHIK